MTTATRRPLLLDTSTAIPLVLPDHEHHDRVVAHCRDRQLGLAGHAHIESYAVLTRLPAPHRRHQETVMRLLAHNFPATVHLPADIAMEAVRQLTERGIAGGAAYDGLVAMAARHHGLPLLTRDARARATYDAFGVEVEVP